MRADIVRFLIAGFINTGLTSLVYFGFAQLIHPSYAYIIAWGLGIVFVAIVYPDKVYVGGKTDRGSRLKIATATFFTFAIGLVTLNLVMLLSNYIIAYGVTLMVTTVVNFFLYRLILRPKEA